MSKSKVKKVPVHPDTQTKRNSFWNEKLVGKTIKSVNADSVNHVTLHFTDGTEESLETELAILEIWGVYLRADDGLY